MRAPGTYASDIQTELVSHGFEGPLLEQFAYFKLPSRFTDPTPVDAASRALLVAALNSSCHWLGQLAFFVSLAVTDAYLAEHLITSLKSSHPLGAVLDHIGSVQGLARSHRTATLKADALTKTAVAKFLCVTVRNRSNFSLRVCGMTTTSS